MISAMRLLLLGILGALVGIEIIWQHICHFDVDVRSYGFSVGMFFALMIGSSYYEYIRKDRCVSSMLFGLAFIIVYAAILTIINYFGLTITGPRIDHFLAEADRALGVNWPALMVFAANHPNLNYVLLIAYQLSIWQPMVLIACLGWKDRNGAIEQFCLALVLGAAITIAIWIVVPSFGAITVYGLPASVVSKLKLSLDLNYANALLNSFAHGPGKISLYSVKGLVAFPSFHTELAIIIAWYARRLGFVFYPVLVFNIIAIASTPIQGGHHVVDVIGGIAVAAFSIFAATRIAQWMQRSALHGNAATSPTAGKMPDSAAAR